MRRRLLDHTYKKTVTGNPAIAKSVARMYPDISFPGFTIQDGEPSPENPVDIVNAQSPVQVEISDGGENIQTVTITSDRPITKWDKLIKQNGVWGWEYNTFDEILVGDDKYKIYYSGVVPGYEKFIFELPIMHGIRLEGFCNIFKVLRSGEIDNFPYVNIGENSNSVIVFSRGKYKDIWTSVDAFKSWVSENNIRIVCQSEFPLFVPLPQEQQTMLNALHTNNPTTVVKNSIGTDVTLTYKTRRSLEVTQ